MPANDNELRTKARLARDKLVNQFFDHPDVSLIDISYPNASKKHKKTTLRIHVKERWFTTKQNNKVIFPKEIDGFSVEIIHGNYELE